MVAQLDGEIQESLMDKVSWTTLSPDQQSFLSNDQINSGRLEMNWLDLLMAKGIINTQSKDKFLIRMLSSARNVAHYFLKHDAMNPEGIIVTRDDWGKKSMDDSSTRDFVFVRWDGIKNSFFLGDLELDVESLNGLLEKLDKDGGPTGSVDSGVTIFTLHSYKEV